jgi:hypothetical protein
MKTIEYWEVSECFDRDSKHIANFSNEADAKVCAAGVYRGYGLRHITIFDTIEDFENNTREKIRERALAKLTVEERRALGISI